MKGVPLQDWITLAIGIVGLVSALLQRIAPRLPKYVQTIIAKIGKQNIINLIAWAQEYASTPEKRKEAAVAELKKVAKNKLGIVLPDSIANLIVEWAVQQYKKIKK